MPVPSKYPRYFDAIPLTTLQQRLQAKTCHGDILRKYTNRMLELTSKGGSSKMPRRHIAGLESYDINNSAKYAVKFGFKSDYLSHVHATDWILAKKSAEGRSRNSIVTTARTARRGGVTAAISGFQHSDTGAHHDQIQALLDYCSPTKADDGSLIRKPYCYLHNDDFMADIRALNEVDIEIAEEEGDEGALSRGLHSIMHTFSSHLPSTIELPDEERKGATLDQAHMVDV